MDLAGFRARAHEWFGGAALRAAKRANTVIVLGRIFAVSPAAQEKLLALDVQLHGLTARASFLGAELANNKLAQLSRILRALTTAVMLDDAPDALKGADAWAEKYWARSKYVATSHRAQTVQEVARSLAQELEAKAASEVPPSRLAVARWLALEVSARYGRLPVDDAERDQLGDAFYSRLPIGEHGAEVDPTGVRRDRPFAADAKASVIAAWKWAGMPAHVADQLFKERRRPKRTVTPP